MSRSPFPSKQPMPGVVRTALSKHDLMDAFRDRPAYQQADYLKWIDLAKGSPMKDKRLTQMLDELRDGKLFKGEPWTPPVKPASPS